MIMVLGTGGTIAGASPRRGDVVGYQAAQIGVESLLDSLGAVPMPLEAEQVMQVDSKDMDFDGWRTLAQALARHLGRPEVTGVVVTHGTDTLEETAYFMHRLLAPAKPVVFTAAMRPATAPMADGPQNLRDAIAVAGEPGARGVVAALAGAVFHPVGIRKWHTFRLDAFNGGDAGPLGLVENGRLRRFGDWPAGVPMELRLVDPAPARWPRVEMVLNHAGADGLLVDWLAEKRVDGIVVAGTGNATVSAPMERAIARARSAGVRVVLSTRCAMGPVIPGGVTAPAAAREPTAVQARIDLLLELLAHRAAGGR